MPDEFPMTMVKPSFNNRSHPDGEWSDAEIRNWIGRVTANSGKYPWRLQWVKDAQAVLAAREKAGAGV